MVKRLVVILII
uniref:Uncharacterized protein n=1 Tax=Arundo donax TaxID=35708 RepID=A0A0A9BGX5_ARUDO